MRITSATTAFAGTTTFKPGMKFTDLNSLTGAIAQIPNVGNLRYPTVDTATGDASYTGGAASCVAPGK